MPEEKKEGADASQQTPEKSNEISTEELKAQIKAELDAQYKNEIIGRDKKLTDLQKELKTKMSDEERIKLEAQEERKAFLDEYAALAGEKLGLKGESLEFIKGGNKDEIKAKIEAFEKFRATIDKEHTAKIQALEDEIKLLKANGTTPAGGQGAPSSERERLIALYNEAEKKGDAVKMLNLKESIKNLPK